MLSFRPEGTSLSRWNLSRLEGGEVKLLQQVERWPGVLDSPQEVFLTGKAVERSQRPPGACPLGS